MRLFVLIFRHFACVCIYLIEFCLFIDNLYWQALRRKSTLMFFDIKPWKRLSLFLSWIFLSFHRAVAFTSHIWFSKPGKVERWKTSLLDFIIWSWPKMKEVKRNEFLLIMWWKVCIRITFGPWKCSLLNSLIWLMLWGKFILSMPFWEENLGKSNSNSNETFLLFFKHCVSHQYFVFVADSTFLFSSPLQYLRD